MAIIKNNNAKNKKITLYAQHDPSQWIKSIAQIFDNKFKISSDWLFQFKNKIAQIDDNQIIKQLSSA